MNKKFLTSFEAFIKKKGTDYSSCCETFCNSLYCFQFRENLKNGKMEVIRFSQIVQNLRFIKRIKSNDPELCTRGQI